MAYTPQNVSVYCAALAGAIAGMMVAGKSPIDQDSEDYDLQVTVAGAFAQQFDTVWGLTSTTTLDGESIRAICHAAWAGKSPQTMAPFFTPTTYNAQCLALKAIVVSGKEYADSQGIGIPVEGISVATYAALDLLATEGLQSGDAVFIASNKTRWILDKTSAQTVSANVCRTALDGGRWLRDLEYAHPFWTAQLNWDFDSVNGNDENSGLASSGFPLKTLDELVRRLVIVDGGQTYTCNALSATVPSTNLVMFRPRVVPGIAGAVCLMKFVGLRTVMTLGSGALVAATATAGNDQATVEWPAVTANFLGRHVRMTSGAANGAVAVILEDLGGGIAEVSEWINESTSVLTATPAALDTYEIVSETSWLAPVQVFSRETQGIDIEFQNVSIDTASIKCQDTTTLRGCRQTVALSGAASIGDLAKAFYRNHAWYFASISSGLGMYTGSFAEIIGGGCINTRMGVTLSSSLRISNFVMNRSTCQTWGPTTASVIVSGGVINNNVATKWGIHRSPASTPAINLLRGITCIIGGTLYGKDNTTAVKVAEGSTLMIKTGAIPTATGTAELNLDDQVTALPDLLASEGAVLPAASSLVSFAEWNAAPFSRHVLSYKSGSKIINVT